MLFPVQTLLLFEKNDKMAIEWLRYSNKWEYKDRFKEHGYKSTKIWDKYSRRSRIEIWEFKKKFKEKFIEI